MLLFLHIREHKVSDNFPSIGHPYRLANLFVYLHFNHVEWVEMRVRVTQKYS